MKTKRGMRYISVDGLQVIALENPQPGIEGIESEVTAISRTSNLKAFADALSKIWPMGRVVILRLPYLIDDQSRGGAYCRCVFDVLTPKRAAQNAERELDRDDG